jgi:hypothetical protein
MVLCFFFRSCIVNNRLCITFPVSLNQSSTNAIIITYAFLINTDVNYTDWYGHKLDSKLFNLLKKH